MIIPIKEILTEATRWKEESQKLSKNSLKRIEKSGIRKPDSVLADGINVGTSNILDKLPNRPKIDTSMNFENYLRSGGGGYDSSTNTIEIPKHLTPGMRLFSSTDKLFQTKGESALSNALSKRHEAYEAKEFNNLKNKEIRNGTYQGNDKVVDKGNFYKERNPLAKIVSGKDYHQIGNHWTGKVLTKEANDLNKMAYTKPVQRFKEYRSDENIILKNNTGIDLNTISNKNISKINKKLDRHESNPNFQAYYIG